MPLTTIKGTNMGAIITNTQLGTSGTASSANVLKGTLAWTGASRSGLTNFAASDPASPNAGDVWYTTGQIKVAANPNLLTGVWSSSGNMTRSQEQGPCCGTLNAGLLAGGENSGYKTQTDFYNGTVWSDSGADLATSRANSPVIGTNTACVIMGGSTGGSTLSSCEEFNGASWSAGGALSDTLSSGVSNAFGTLSAGVLAGGSLGGSTVATTQKYNGTAWSAGNNLLATRNYSACAGKNSAGVVTGGTGNLTTTEEYDGTSWVAAGALNTGRAQLTGDGTQTAALVFAGSTGSNSVVTEEYNGTAWTAANSMTTARRSAGGAGSQSQAFVTGGYGSGYLNSTEEYTKPQIQYYNV
jgi:hypothetical protein